MLIEPDVNFEVRHKESVTEVVGQLVLLQVIVDETKEDIVRLPGLVRQESNDAGDVDASQQHH